MTSSTTTTVQHAAWARHTPAVVHGCAPPCNMAQCSVVTTTSPFAGTAKTFRFDVYGYPTLETRVASRAELAALAAHVRSRVPPWIFKAKLREARGAVAKLRGDTADAGDDLARLLELCAHAKAHTPADYCDELRAMAAWLAFGVDARWSSSACAASKQHAQRLIAPRWSSSSSSKAAAAAATSSSTHDVSTFFGGGMPSRGPIIAPVTESEHEDDSDDQMSAESSSCARVSEEAITLAGPTTDAGAPAAADPTAAGAAAEAPPPRRPVVTFLDREARLDSVLDREDLARVLCDIRKSCPMHHPQTHHG